MKSIMLIYIVGIVAMLTMLVCIAVEEKECAFICSVVELTAFIIGNFIQSERVLNYCRSLEREVCKISSDIVLTKNSVDYIGNVAKQSAANASILNVELKSRIDKLTTKVDDIANKVG